MTHTDRDHTPVAEQITELLTELHDRVDTRETVLRYREVKRGGGRTAAVADFTAWCTRRPGLLTQLGAAAVPQGSPGWDADGALSPTPSGGSFESAEPVADAWHVADEIRAGLRKIGEDLHAEGWRPPDTLVTVALADEHTGERIAARLRSLVSRARIAAGYDVPVKLLRDMYCRYCGGPMHVRADASSAVWCSGTVPLHGPAVVGGPWPIGWERCGANWPRGSWVRLLEEATTGERMGA